VKGQYLSRRKFISKSALIFGGAYAAISSTALLDNLYGWVNNCLQTNYKQELYRNSPIAKYWISTSAKENCLDCHSSSQINGKSKFDHGETIVKCLLCAQGCVIKENESGKCRARMNINGSLKSLVYGRPISIHVDPIEKKPFYHFLPGSQAYSLATAGCPLSCQFCQNWEISQAKPENYQVKYILPEEIVSNSKSQNIPVIAFTYNEPTVFIEYL
jgi:pyruvate formate lyase activating enzyme